MEFITTGNRIAVENFSIGKIYTIVWATGNYKSLACVGKGSDFVMFQDQAPDLLFCLTMETAVTVESIEEGGGGSGTNNYNELENKPSINGIVLVGNKTGADLNLVSQADLDDYATNASVVAGLATKQDALSSSQLAAVNSGITSALVTQIGTNTTAIAGKQDALSSSQLQAVNSGITSALVTQIGTNTSAIAGKQDALSSSQLQAVNSGITSALVTQIGTNTSAIAGKQDALSSSQLQAVNSGITSALVTQIGTNTSAIAGKQDALSSSQLAAVNSGITSADVAQITTNKNNISLLGGGGRNVFKYTNLSGSNNEVSYVTNSDGSITVTVASTTAANRELALTEPIENTFDTMKISGSPAIATGDVEYLITGLKADGTYQNEQFSYNAAVTTINRGTPKIKFSIYVKTGTAAGTYTFYPMIQSADNQTAFSTFTPYIPTLADIAEMLNQ